MISNQNHSDISQKCHLRKEKMNICIAEKYAAEEMGWEGGQFLCSEATEVSQLPQL